MNRPLATLLLLSMDKLGLPSVTVTATEIPLSLATPSANSTTSSKSHRSGGISVYAPIDEFRKFRDSLKHPAVQLGIDITGENYKLKEKSGIGQLCEELMITASDFQRAMEELSVWKNEFVKQNIPSSVKLSLVLLFSRLFRRSVRIR